MPNTPKWAIPYAGPNDAPNGFGQEQAIAEAVEAGLNVLAVGLMVTAITDSLWHNVVDASNVSPPVGVWKSDTSVPGFTVSPGGVHPKVAGTYLAMGGLTFDGSGGTAGRRGIWPTVNGEDVLGWGRREIGPAAPGGTSVSLQTQLLKLGVGDAVSFYPYQSSGQTIKYNYGLLSLMLVSR